MATDHVYNLIILDESGSMESIKRPTISGFNELVQTIRSIEKQFPGQKHYISFVTFNGTGIRTRLDRQPVEGLTPIDANTYHPASMTPLYDAVALSVLKLRMDLAGVENLNVLVTIFTDGEENASREFSGRQLKAIIDEQKERGWTFTYIGANHDVEKVAEDLSIQNRMKYDANDAGLKRVFSLEADARQKFSRNIRDKKDPRNDYYVPDKEESSPEKA